jgi:hypothetical protein
MRKFTNFTLTTLALVFCSTLMPNKIFAAANKVNSATVGAQSGPVTYGTVTAVTYVVTLNCSAGTSAGTATLAITGLPANAVATYSTGTGGTAYTVVAGTITLPASSASGNVTMTITNSATCGSITPSGSFTVTVTPSSGGSTAGTCTYLVDKKPLTVTGATASNKVYDGLTTATITGGSLVGVICSDVVTLNQSGTFASPNVGTGIAVTSTSTITGAGAVNYTLTQPAGLTANITARPLTITANDVSKVYGATLTGGPGSTAFTSSGLQNGETIGTVTIAYGAAAAATAAVGVYAGQVTPSAAIGGSFTASNYSITYATGTITVTARPLTITANGVSKVYGATLTGGAGSTAFTSSGLQNGETIGTVTIAYGAAAAATAAVGVYPGQVTASAATGGTFTASNYSITYATGTITVTARPLTITANDVSKLYGATLTGGAGSTAFTSSGLQNAETIGTVTIAYGAAAAATAAVGVYPNQVTASAATGGTFTASNYSISYVQGTITVTQRTLTITANNASHVYGTVLGGAGAGSLAFTSVGLQNAETIGSVTIAYGTGATATDAVGTYTNQITASLATGGSFNASNYSISYVQGTITVTTKPLTITANNQSKCSGTTFTFAGTEFTTSGLINSDAVTSATITSTGSGAGAAPGGYPILISAAVGSGLGNYTITYTSGTMTVNTAPGISTQPSNVIICAPTTTASFTIVATGTSPTYQWQRDAGSGFVNITSAGMDAGVTYANWTTATLNLTAITTAVNNYIYRCVVTVAGCTSLNSNSATLSFPVAPTAPDVSRCGPGTVTLLASGGAYPNYLWYDASTGGNLLGVGSSFTTPSIAVTTPYYVSSVSLGSETSQASAGSFTFACTNAGAELDWNVVNNVATPVVVTRISATCTNAGTHNYQIYYRTNTYVGNDANATGWIQIFNGTANVPGANSVVTFDVTDFAIPVGGTYGVLIWTDDKFTFDNAGNTAIGPDINIVAGSYLCAQTTGPFGGTALFAGATFGGSVYYKLPSCASPRTTSQAIINSLPTVQTTTFTSSSITTTTMTVGWTRGNGDNVIVLAHAGAPVDADPVAGTSYTANAAFGSGSQIGTGNYVVYDGTGTSVNLTALTSSTTYYFAAYEYKNGTLCYLTPALVGNYTTTCLTPTTQASTITFTGVTNTTMNVNWVNGNGGSRIVVAKLASSPAGTPTNGTVYPANAVFGSGSTIAAGEFVVYNGSGSSVTVTGLTANTTYCFRVYEYNCGGANTKYLSTTNATNPLCQITSTSCTPTYLMQEDFEGTGATPSGTWTGQVITGPPASQGNWWFMGTTTAAAKTGWFTITGAGACAANDATLTGSYSPRVSFYKSGPPGAGYYCDYSAIATATTDLRLYTPAINSTGYTGLTLTFNYVGGMNANDNVQLQYSLNGSTWVPISGELYNTSVTTTTLRTVSLPAALNNVPTFYIGWNFNSTSAASSAPPTFIFDDVKIFTYVDASVASVSGTSPLCIGGTATYTANSAVLSGGTGTWSSGNTGIATVNPTTGLVTGVGPGTTTITYTINGGCGSTPPSASQSVTINPNASIASVSGASPVCVGGTATYTANSAVLGGGSGAWSSSNTGVATVDPVTGVVTGVAAGTANIIYTITGGCGGTISQQAAVTVVNTGTWIGAINTDWHTAGNWCGGVPTAATNVVIPTTTNQPVIGAAAVCKNITINASASLTISGSNTLTVSGNWTNNGTFTMGTSTVTFNGAALQTLGGTSGTDFYNLTVLQNVNATGLNSVTNTFDFASAASKTFAITAGAGNELILKSSAAMTARIAPVPATDNITGTVRAQRYYPAHRAWRLISVPVTSTQSVLDAFMEGGPANPSVSPFVNNNPNPGYGTHVSGGLSLAGAVAGGFDVTNRNNPSMKFYVSGTPPNDIWTGIASTAVNVNTANGYMLFVRGDRSTNLPLDTYAPPSPTILQPKGSVRIGTQPAVSILANNFGVFGNPYCSEIDFHTLTRLNVNDIFSVWDPNATGLNGVGAWVTFTWTLGSYSVVPASYTAGLGQYIQSGQAVLVQNSSLIAGSIMASEANKTSGSTVAPFTPTTLLEQFRTNVYRLESDGSTLLVDGSLAVYDNSFSAGIDDVDAWKPTNPTSETISHRNLGRSLAIEARPIIGLTDTLFYNISLFQRAYRFEFIADGLDHPGLRAYLHDYYLNTDTPLSLNGTSTVDFVTNSNIASRDNNRFIVVFTTDAPLPVTLKSIKAYEHNTGINVDWSVNQQINTDRYEVEKSLIGYNFSKSGTVPATAISGSADYTWFDATPNMGANFYRVKMIDKNGVFSYSSVVKVVISRGAPSISIYPNPAVDGIINLQMTNIPKGAYQIKVINSLGQVVMVKQIQHEEGSSSETLRPDQQLAHGTYQLEITGDNVKLTTKLIY